MSTPESSDAARGMEQATSDEISSLTKRLVAGEEDAWRELHTSYAPRLWRYLLVVARGNDDAAAEGLQQTFIRAARYARRWDTEAELWGWLTLLARQVMANERRAMGRWREFLQRFTGELSTATVSISNDPMLALLDASWADLLPEDRLLLERKYYEGQSVRDLARAEGVSEKSIESRLTRARARLREKMLNHQKL